SLFFFQAEDGIRDRNVTGVQTCALPIFAEKPRLAPHIPQMKQNIARALGIAEGAVGIAAGTNEGLGYLGRGEGVTVIANALIKTDRKSTRLNSSHVSISYAVFCVKKKMT